MDYMGILLQSQKTVRRRRIYLIAATALLQGLLFISLTSLENYLLGPTSVFLLIVGLLQTVLFIHIYDNLQNPYNNVCEDIIIIFSRAVKAGQMRFLEEHAAVFAVLEKSISLRQLFIAAIEGNREDSVKYLLSIYNPKKWLDNDIIELSVKANRNVFDLIRPHLSTRQILFAETIAVKDGNWDFLANDAISG